MIANLKLKYALDFEEETYQERTRNTKTLINKDNLPKYSIASRDYTEEVKEYVDGSPFCVIIEASGETCTVKKFGPCYVKINKNIQLGDIICFFGDLGLIALENGVSGDIIRCSIINELRRYK